ncbi:aminoacyl-tRNA hydrolase [Acetanaerobacterium elongatum]|uniref:Peptidyl-tRNA hydrolase n=1 Tax=Acetanaerobacterium elongatum TaxID=258515 RepID=A0A1G9ZW13_9FIRM|nr:aminoacyl-tRNA hydrolase [Acetanaerobacterium elongatum]SDN25287.1 peptidyl-tRNA hydrolase, PTH1 family [Acetanaerobacterium elongatum]
MFLKQDKTKPAGSVEYIIVGLGNPGKQYEFTRHNAGFLALDELAQAHGIKVDRLKFKSLCGTGSIDGAGVLLLKPQTYMNLSGEAVVEAMHFYKVPPERVVIIFDDISLDVGRMRIRRKGSDGGHNGMKNIIYLTGSDEFPRVKLGIGAKPYPDYDLAAWVTSRFTKEEGAKLEEVFKRAAEAVRIMLTGDIEAAMGKFNS